MDVGGTVYHALNRANFRSGLFKNQAHYRDFLVILEETLAVVPMRILQRVTLRKRLLTPFSLTPFSDPFFFNKTVPKGTLRAILKQAGLSPEEFVRNL